VQPKHPNKPEKAIQTTATMSKFGEFTAPLGKEIT
jgi:hypothetical protein